MGLTARHPLRPYALAAAAHAITGQTLPLGQDKRGVFMPITDENRQAFEPTGDKQWVSQAFDLLDPVNAAKKHFFGAHHDSAPKEWRMPQAWHCLVEQLF